MDSIRFIDTHTAGEPTRVVFAGGPDLGGGTLAERLTAFVDHYDQFRSSVIHEPRGSDVLVGALLLEPTRRESVAAVIFFNNVGVLGMCGHGLIGVVVALARLGRINPGRSLFETPVGDVSVEFDGQAVVALENVPSYRLAADVVVDVPGFGPVNGDVAWGGNWFFLSEYLETPISLAHADALANHSWQIRQALEREGITGQGGALIDHIELTGPPFDGRNQARNFVLCPGRAYDRSPCGTGTSARLACLAADGSLRPGEIWRQEGILGTVFEGSYQPANSHVIPTIRGSAFVIAEGTLLFDPDDPFRSGIRA